MSADSQNRVPDDQEMLAEQVEHYRRRAPIYDSWWQRTGRYEVDSKDRQAWLAEVDQVAAELDRFGARGSVLELAGGTGWWTRQLASTATTLTVVDSAPEAIAMNRQRVQRDDVRYVEADLFDWAPDEPNTFDVVFFSFWLSHVPRPRFDAFWVLVDHCLVPEGRAFLIDNRRPTAESGDPYVAAYEGDVQVRRLADGSELRVVKVYYEPGGLVAELHRLGWEAQVKTTARMVYGHARRPTTPTSRVAP
jgi:demethylmenaquinone methyltransferase/2-methoxy-6-polyprenyl-1,4-benzoquinol methylase